MNGFNMTGIHCYMALWFSLNPSPITCHWARRFTCDVVLIWLLQTTKRFGNAGGGHLNVFLGRSLRQVLSKRMCSRRLRPGGKLADSETLAEDAEEGA